MTSTLAAITADQALATLGRLREAWDWLAEAVTPGPARHVERQLADGARKRLDRLVLAERADRVEILRAGRTPAADTAVPARLGALDAQVQIAQHLDDCAWRAASHLRRTGPSYRPDGRSTDQKATAALDYLAGALHHLEDANLITDVHGRLDAADQLARSIAGVGPDRRVVKAECPACGRRSLHADVGSPRFQEWAVLCVQPACRCRGIGCACNRPTRYPGARHVWPEREWAALARLLTRQDLAA